MKENERKWKKMKENEGKWKEKWKKMKRKIKENLFFYVFLKDSLKQVLSINLFSFLKLWQNQQIMTKLAFSFPLIPNFFQANKITK